MTSQDKQTEREGGWVGWEMVVILTNSLTVDTPSHHKGYHRDDIMYNRTHQWVTFYMYKMTPQGSTERGRGRALGLMRHGIG